MLRIVIAIFIGLHGLVHLWYLTLSQRWVAYQAEMGWTGESWAFTGWLGAGFTRSLASVLFVVATLGFLAGSLGHYTRASWWQPLLAGVAVFSSAVLLLFWDGQLGRLVEKGLLGVLINLGILVAVLLLAR